MVGFNFFSLLLNVCCYFSYYKFSWFCSYGVLIYFRCFSIRCAGILNIEKNESIERYQHERHSSRSVKTQSKIERTQKYKKNAQAMLEQSNRKISKCSRKCFSSGSATREKGKNLYNTNRSFGVYFFFFKNMHVLVVFGKHTSIK